MSDVNTNRTSHPPGPDQSRVDSPRGVLFGADRPLETPEEDRLGVANFAANIAEAILAQPKEHGLVVGLYGPWGAGKTSVLNLVQAALLAEPAERRPLVVKFDPWWFSGESALTSRFFEALLSEVGGWGERGRKIVDGLRDFSEVVGETVPQAGPLKIFGRRGKERSLTKTKDRLVELLREHNQRIVVIVDDVDRISGDEMRDLFRLIRAVADFPNVTYLVALDRVVAAKALGKVQDGGGEEFLAKIIQVPFDLPPPSPTALTMLLSEHLEAVLADTGSSLAGRDRLSQIYGEGLSRLLRTPRDVTRFVNTLQFTYSQVKGEVNAADFIALEALRVRVPELYDLIRRNQGEFAGSPQIMEGFEPPIDTAFHEAWAAEQPAELLPTLKHILLGIFPRLQAVWSTPTDFDSGRWERELRAASPRVLPTYFSFAVPGGVVSRAEVLAVLATVEDKVALEARLADLAASLADDPTARAAEVLARLADLAPDLTSSQAGSIIEGLCEMGDRFLVTDGLSGRATRLGSEIPLARLFNALLPRVVPGERFSLLERGFRSGRGLATVVDFIVMLGWEHGKYQGTGPASGAPLLSLENQEALETLLLHRIREAAADRSLLENPRLAMVLFRWRAWAGEEGEGEVQAWTKAVSANDNGLLILLEHFVRRVSFASAGASGAYYRLNPEWLADLIDRKTLCERARWLVASASELSEAQRTALDQLVRECNALDQGQNPDDVDWMRFALAG